jgi:hypothetical protein
MNCVVNILTIHCKALSFSFLASQSSKNTLILYFVYYWKKEVLVGCSLVYGPIVSVFNFQITRKSKCVHFHKSIKVMPYIDCSIVWDQNKMLPNIFICTNHRLRLLRNNYFPATENEYFYSTNYKNIAYTNIYF